MITATIVPSDYVPALAEIWMMLMICVTLIAGLFSSKDSVLTCRLAKWTVILAALLTWYSYIDWGSPDTLIIFHQQFVLDLFAATLKIAVCGIVFCVFFYSHTYNQDRNIPSEFYVLGLLSTLGMMILISGHDLLPIYLGMELFSLPIYAMAALERRQGRCIEAAMKYFIMGALASGLLLYGLSLIFGMTQSLNISVIASHIMVLHGSSIHILMIALVFIFAGIGFKFGLVPFHMWVPDVYEGTSTSVTLFISTAPKIAAFALVVRLVLEALPELKAVSQELCITFAVLSIAIGNVVAIVQTHLKRMFAYSSIAHMGYVFLGFAAMTARGDAAALFYVITYAITTLVAFGLLVILSRAGFEMDKMEDLSGLSSRNPWLAFLMLMALFSMAGIPPFVGFIAKVGLLEALVAAHLVWLAVFALVFAIIGSFYYLRVVRMMYFDEPQNRMPLLCSTRNKVVMSINGFAVLLLGLFPGALFVLCHHIFQ